MMESGETEGSGRRTDTFIRRFDASQLRDHRDDGVIAALFDRWVLPGESAGTHGLRVAIRNFHLNFYVKGQSVGAFRLVAGRPRLRLHRKYRAAAENGSRRAAALGQAYETLDADALKTTSAAIVDGWIRTAETYAGDEKRFVDDLVAVTPGTIDLEMGLPADEDAVGEDRTAPRMDLVVAQGRAIAFWEAKCAVNGELRARAAYRESPEGRYEAGPHVLWQLRRYERGSQPSISARAVSATSGSSVRKLLKITMRPLVMARSPGFRAKLSGRPDGALRPCRCGGSIWADTSA